MQTILITGAGPNGITGRRIKDCLVGKFNILSPSSKELNLVDETAVNEYFNSHTNIDYVIHSAVQYTSSIITTDTNIYKPHNSRFSYMNRPLLMGGVIRGYVSEIYSQNIRMFENIRTHSSGIKKIFYFGSGAEYDKTRDIKLAGEPEIGIRIPQSEYGLFKFKINEEARKSRNIYNLRLFGTLNPYESPRKNVVCNLMAKAICGQHLNLQRDCIFSFVDIDDVAAFIEFAICHDLKHHDYNLTSGKPYRLSEIAKMIREMVNPDLKITFATEGLNKEYTGSDVRWRKEFPQRTPILDSLRKIYDHLSKNRYSIDIETIDDHWSKMKNQ